MEWSASVISDEIALLKPGGIPPWELFWRQPVRAGTGVLGPVYKQGFFWDLKHVWGFCGGKKVQERALDLWFSIWIPRKTQKKLQTSWTSTFLQKSLKKVLPCSYLGDVGECLPPSEAWSAAPEFNHHTEATIKQVGEEVFWIWSQLPQRDISGLSELSPSVPLDTHTHQDTRDTCLPHPYMCVCMLTHSRLMFCATPWPEQHTAFKAYWLNQHADT